MLSIHKFEAIFDFEEEKKKSSSPKSPVGYSFLNSPLWNGDTHSDASILGTEPSSSLHSDASEIGEQAPRRQAKQAKTLSGRKQNQAPRPKTSERASRSSPGVNQQHLRSTSVTGARHGPTSTSRTRRPLCSSNPLERDQHPRAQQYSGHDQAAAAAIPTRKWEHWKSFLQYQAGDDTSLNSTTSGQVKSWKPFTENRKKSGSKLKNSKTKLWEKPDIHEHDWRLHLHHKYERNISPCHIGDSLVKDFGALNLKQKKPEISLEAADQSYRQYSSTTGNKTASFHSNSQHERGLSTPEQRSATECIQNRINGNSSRKEIYTISIDGDTFCDPIEDELGEFGAKTSSPSKTTHRLLSGGPKRIPWKTVPDQYSWPEANDTKENIRPWTAPSSTKAAETIYLQPRRSRPATVGAKVNSNNSLPQAASPRLGATLKKDSGHLKGTLSTPRGQFRKTKKQGTNADPVKLFHEMQSKRAKDAISWKYQSKKRIA